MGGCYINVQFFAIICCKLFVTALNYTTATKTWKLPQHRKTHEKARQDSGDRRRGAVGGGVHHSDVVGVDWNFLYGGDDEMKYELVKNDTKQVAGKTLSKLYTSPQPAQQEPPAWWPAVENILKEYGLQAIDFVADFKAALAEQPAPVQQEPVAITAQMAIAFHDAITDAALGTDDLMDIMRGLKAAFLHIAAPQPAVQQEPVATVVEHLGFVDGIIRFYGTENMEQLPVGTMLYTSPPAKRKPLTDEQIEAIRVGEEFNQWGISETAFKYVARSIEAAHGIKENT